MSEPPIRDDGSAPGSEPPFRAEALAHHRAQTGPGRVLRVAPAWTRALFWLLTVTAVAGIVAGSLVKVDRVTFVPATVEGAQVRAVLGAALADAVAPGDDSRLILPDRDALAVRIVAVARPGTAGAPPGARLLTGRAQRPTAASGGSLRVRTGSRSLLADLVPGL